MVKRLLPYLLLLLFIAGCGSFGGYWWYVGRHLETTDNAYIRADITPVSGKLSGYVAELLVSDNQRVVAGQTLLRIDTREYRLHMARGESVLLERQEALRVARGKRAQQHSQIELARAELAAAQAESVRATQEFGRYSRLHGDAIVSEVEYDAALARRQTCHAQVRAAQARLNMAKQQLTVLRAEESRIEAAIGQHRQELKLLQQQLDDAEVIAPISGIVGNRRVKKGQFIRPGTVLMSLIPTEQVWVEANFKEVQLAAMRQQQPVVICIDAFPGQQYFGRIESFSPASGAEFSILPPENASGNFTKIVQRIPVKIAFDAGQELAGVRPGMSAEVAIDTRVESGLAGEGRLVDSGKGR